MGGKQACEAEAETEAEAGTCLAHPATGRHAGAARDAGGHSYVGEWREGALSGQASCAYADGGAAVAGTARRCTQPVTLVPACAAGCGV